MVYFNPNNFIPYKKTSTTPANPTKQPRVTAAPRKLATVGRKKMAFSKKMGDKPVITTEEEIDRVRRFNEYLKEKGISYKMKQRKG